jgi:hypothetical protein
MLRSRWGAVVARDKFEDGAKLLIDAIPMSERFSMFKRNPGACNKSESCHEIAFELYALIFSITTLNLLMSLLLYLPLQDTSSGRLIKTSGFQDVCRINPVVMATAHNMFLEIGTELKFVDGYLR